VITEWAIPFWFFVTLFLVLPLGAVIWMTIERRRERRQRKRGFEVKLNAGEEPAVKEEREIDHG